MARKAKHDPFMLADGRKVSFGFKVRSGVYYVRFPDPDDPARYLVITTGQTTEGKAYPEAAKIVLRHYMPEEQKRVQSAKWETVVADLADTAELKARSLEVYTCLLNVFRGMVPTTGPGDVDVKKAQEFKNKYQKTGFTKSNKPGATVYPRKPKTVENSIRRMSALWGYLRKMKYATTNPWAEIERPTVPDTIPDIPEEGDFAHCLQWLRTAYPEYTVLHLLIEVKMLAGCRLLDVCSLLADDLDADNKTVLIRWGTDKTSKERLVPLPDDLFDTLDKIKGPVWLWESYTTYRPTNTRPGRRNLPDFKPERFYSTVQEYLDKYNRRNPDRTPITSHDLRRRAVTLLTEATGSIDTAAAAVGMTPATARKHYLDSKKAFDSQKVLRQHADKLRGAATATG